MYDLKLFIFSPVFAVCFVGGVPYIYSGALAACLCANYFLCRMCGKRQCSWYFLCNIVQVLPSRVLFPWL